MHYRLGTHRPSAVKHVLTRLLRLRLRCKVAEATPDHQLVVEGQLRKAVHIEPLRVLCIVLGRRRGRAHTSATMLVSHTSYSTGPTSHTLCPMRMSL